MEDPSTVQSLSVLNVALSELPLRPSSLAWWHQKGIRSTRQVQQGLHKHAAASLIQWTADLQAPSLRFLARLYQEVQDCLEDYATTRPTAARESNPPVVVVRGQTAAELLQLHWADAATTTTQANNNTALFTFCQGVDELLGGGGLPLGEVTEIAGPPGVGKTQWAMQLALNVQAPPFFCQGLAGSVLYIDTEGSMTAERCYEMAKHFVHHVTQQYTNYQPSSQTPPNASAAPLLPDWFTVEGVLEGIQVVRCYDVATLDATISTLETTVSPATANGRPVRLVIIDSLAFPVRAESTSDNFMARTQQLTQWAMKLSMLSRTYPPKAVVVLNQMTTTSSSTTHTGGGTVHNKENNPVGSGTNITLIPALGEAWAHAVTNRIVLGPSSGRAANEERIFRLVKSPRYPPGETKYVITEQGIRDAPGM